MSSNSNSLTVKFHTFHTQKFCVKARPYHEEMGLLVRAVDPNECTTHKKKIKKSTQEKDFDYLTDLVLEKAYSMGEVKFTLFDLNNDEFSDIEPPYSSILEDKIKNVGVVEESMYSILRGQLLMKNRKKRKKKRK